MKYVLSYGGGINSSALYFYILEKNLPLDCVIFADTGEEHKETYEAVEKMKKLCLSEGIKFMTVKSHLGNLYDYYFDKKKVMSLMKRDCTSKFKISPIRKYIRNVYGKKERFVMYIGIAYDEATRMRDSDVKYITNCYPFCDDKISRNGNLQILKKNDFYAVKSGCIGCIYNRKKNWIKMIVESPEEFDRHLRLEEQNTGFPKVLLNGSYSLRSLRNAYIGQKSLTAFIENEANCDVAGSCFL